MVAHYRLDRILSCLLFYFILFITNYTSEGIVLQGRFLLAWRFRGSAHHGDRCTAGIAGRELYANFDYESDGNVWNGLE
jgi:hypothetical protein